ncbi:MAG: TIGR04283 family arsenosugar biosynthesis glycosyltransferase [Pseudomonadota bacterium]
MTAPLSIIIPTLNAADRLGPTLGALSDGLFESLIRDVILTDGGSTDPVAEIADAVGARFITGPKGRGTQLAAGAAEATGDWLLFLHADTVLSPGWAGAVRAHVAAHPDQAAYFRLGFDQGGLAARLTAGWANFRSRIFGLPYGDQGLLIPRRLYTTLGGYPDLALMEDVALARRIGRRRMRMLPVSAVTSAQRYVNEGWAQRGFRNLTTLLLFGLGVPADRLARWYSRR